MASRALALWRLEARLPSVQHAAKSGPGDGGSPRLRTLSVAGYLLMVAGLVGLIATRSLFSRSPVVIAVQSVAVCLMIWARISFGRRSFHAAGNPTEGGLVTWGPYHYIRHPIYTAVTLFVSAGAAGNPSWTAALLGALVWAGALARIFCEEILVTARYPEYREYAARTWRMIPFVF
jgi:protein-S-isoprenylcysteine O-methyltransferase Ste14